MKKIEQLLNEQNKPNTDESMNAKAQDVSGYTTETVIELLKKSLNIHWQQTTALSAQAVHLERWRYKKLAKAFQEDAIEEHKHVTVNLGRLEFFDVDYQPLVVNSQIWKRHDVKAIIEFNLDSVRRAADVEKTLIKTARNAGDELTANETIPLLQGSESGIRVYEGYLKLIEQMGIDNFLTLQT